MTFKDRFRAIATSVSCAFGSPWALATAVALVLVWALTGHYFRYSDGWQLVINTGTTIVTFLMAFLIQATQYRESRALHLKIDELIRAVQGARNGFVNLEDLSDDQLEALALDLKRVGGASKILPIKRTDRPSDTAEVGDESQPEALDDRVPAKSPRHPSNAKGSTNGLAEPTKRRVRNQRRVIR